MKVARSLLSWPIILSDWVACLWCDFCNFRFRLIDTLSIKDEYAYKKKKNSSIVCFFNHDDEINLLTIFGDSGSRIAKRDSRSFSYLMH